MTNQTHKGCTRCKKNLPVEDFYVQSQTGKKDKSQVWKYYDSTCKSCRKDYTRERSLETKRLAVKYKGGKCEDCKKSFHPNVFDFHHLDPDKKEFGIAERIVRNIDNNMKRELDKCVLLCANCHRERHIVLVL